MTYHLSKRIKLTLTERQYDELEARAEAGGVDISQLVRSWLLPLADEGNAHYEERYALQFPLVGLGYGEKKFFFVRVDNRTFHTIGDRACREGIPVSTWVREYLEQYILHCERYLKINGKIVQGVDDAWVTTREEHVRRGHKAFVSNQEENEDNSLFTAAFMQEIFNDELRARARMPVVPPVKKKKPGEQRAEEIHAAADKIIELWKEHWEILQGEGTVILFGLLLKLQGYGLEKPLTDFILVAAADGWLNKKRIVKALGREYEKRKRRRPRKVFGARARE